MPAPGTRKVIIDGNETFLPEEEALLETMLQEGCILQQRIEVDKLRLQKVKEKIISIAAKRRGTRGTVKLEGQNGRSAEVVWQRKTQVDVSRADDLREPLGKAWGKVFNERISITLARSYKAFMRTSQGELEKHKKAIAATIEVVESNPSCKLHDVAEDLVEVDGG